MYSCLKGHGCQHLQQPVMLDLGTFALAHHFQRAFEGQHVEFAIFLNIFLVEETTFSLWLGLLDVRPLHRLSLRHFPFGCNDNVRHAYETCTGCKIERDSNTHAMSCAQRAAYFSFTPT
jgi:hypothetical protein